MGLLLRSHHEPLQLESFLAIDGGVHASAMQRLSGLAAPNATQLFLAENAGCSTSAVGAIAITHPHLDHFAGFAINSAGFQTKNPVALAALPWTITALKTHIYNGVIWPNLSTEDAGSTPGAGFLRYVRLTPHKYTSLVASLEIAAFPVSHGHIPRGHTCSGHLTAKHCENATPKSSLMSRLRMALVGRGAGRGEASVTANDDSKRDSTDNHVFPVFAPATLPFDASETPPSLQSTAFFVREKVSQQEVLIFGDVEADSLSANPRNRAVWAEAAQKIVNGRLSVCFIECSFPKGTDDRLLYGHLSPTYLMEELSVLAELAQQLDPTRSPPLEGFRVMVIHVKQTAKEADRIARELQDLEAELGLGVLFCAVKQGDTFAV
jgi:3',5'-cyclic-nucleotide phosphodiesterase